MEFARDNLLASPGALVIKDDQQIRIHAAQHPAPARSRSTASRSGKSLSCAAGAVIELLEDRPSAQHGRRGASVPVDVIRRRRRDQSFQKRGLVVHSGAGHADGTLVNGLLARFPGIASVGDETPGIDAQIAIRAACGRRVRRTLWPDRLVEPDLGACSVPGVANRAGVGDAVQNNRGVIDTPIQRVPQRTANAHGGAKAERRHRVRAAGRVQPAGMRCSTAGSRPGGRIRSGCTSARSPGGGRRRHLRRLARRSRSIGRSCTRRSSSSTSPPPASA